MRRLLHNLFHEFFADWRPACGNYVGNGQMRVNLKCANCDRTSATIIPVEDRANDHF